MKQFALSQNVLFHHYGNEGILLNLETETYFALNEMGIQMLQTLSSTQSVEDAVKQIADEYDVPLDVLRADMEEFIQSLQRVKLIDGND